MPSHDITAGLDYDNCSTLHEQILQQQFKKADRSNIVILVFPNVVFTALSKKVGYYTPNRQQACGLCLAHATVEIILLVEKGLCPNPIFKLFALLNFNKIVYRSYLKFNMSASVLPGKLKLSQRCEFGDGLHFLFAISQYIFQYIFITYGLVSSCNFLIIEQSNLLNLTL